MSRKLSDHQINRFNNQVQIDVMDDPGPGGANHRYQISLTSAPDSSDFPLTGAFSSLMIDFQNGPLKESGINGVSDEALFAILIDRLRGFQKGQYSCRENAVALTKLEESLMWLHKRTLNREARGVEGTSAA